ncbi:hypothetical protein [uncultured Friedmanniella sp.]|uniref:hypothetical protein n=1 Tax=uncultured Friedmanniella sp. TaxID=335381 RepID=UPI0035CBA1D5
MIANLTSARAAPVVMVPIGSGAHGRCRRAVVDANQLKPVDGAPAVDHGRTMTRSDGVENGSSSKVFQTMRPSTAASAVCFGVAFGGIELHEWQSSGIGFYGRQNFADFSDSEALDSPTCRLIRLVIRPLLTDHPVGQWEHREFNPLAGGRGISQVGESEDTEVVLTNAKVDLAVETKFCLPLF